MQKELSYPVDIRTVTAKGINVKFDANTKECAALAKRFDLVDVKSLTAVVTLKRVGLIAAEGSFKAKIVQNCVVTLEPFETTVSEKFKVFFQTEKQPDLIDIDLEDEDIETVTNGIIDLGEVVAEQFGLSLDPFPKKSEKQFIYEEKLSPDEEKQKNPFADLKKLMKK